MSYTTLTGHTSLLALFSLPVFLAAAFFSAQQVNADQLTSSASVGNTPPVASSVDIDNAAITVHLTENATTTVTVKATITDNNGCEDIESVQVKFYRNNVGADAADDDNNHYTVSATSDGKCTGGGADLTDTYTATISVNYYADPTDAGSVHSGTHWTAQVIPSDQTTGTAATDTIEMSTLTALNVSGTISYGTVGLGNNTGTTDQTATVTNTGNEGIDVDLDGYGSKDGDGNAMTCTVGSFAVGYEKYSASANTAYASKVALTDSATELDVDIPQRTTVVSTGKVYWGLGMPDDGVNGNCSGVIVFTANSDPNLD